MKKVTMLVALSASVLSLFVDVAAQTTPQYFAATGHWYQFVPIQSVTWSQARDAAISRGGYLASITSQAENDFIMSLNPPAPGCWIGGTDQVVEGTWQWVSGEPWSFELWSSGEPNGQAQEYCLELMTANIHGDVAGFWNDHPNENFEETSYIVEFNTNPIPEIVPVVLVHGWKHDPDVWSMMKSWLLADGFYVFEAQLNDCGHPDEAEFMSGNNIFPKKMFRGNANALGIQIAGYVASLPLEVRNRVSRVDILAHSMGGLIARRYLNRKTEDTWPYIPVRKVIMLGTPNNGSEAAGVISTYICVGPAGNELEDDKMTAFNAEFPYRRPFSVEYSVIYGAGACTGQSWFNPNPCGAIKQSSTGWFLECPHDVAVEKQSAIGVNGGNNSVAYPRNWEYPFLCHSDLYRDASVYSQRVLPILRGTLTPERDEWESTILDSITSDYLIFHNLSILPSTVYEDSIVVIGESELLVACFASDSMVNMTLGSPSGLILDSLSVSSDSSYGYFTGGSGSIGFYVRNPESGVWKLRVGAPVTTGPVDALVVSKGREGFSIVGWQSSKILVEGDSLILTVSKNPSGLANATPVVTGIPIWNDSDTLPPASFWDDGLHYDGDAGDDIYGCIVSNFPSTSGILKMTVTCLAEIGGISASRQLEFSAYVQGYLCGDADRSEMVNISDAVFLINYIFAGGDEPNPVISGDADCNGIVNISDAVNLINYIFAGSVAPCAACR